jgi:hypothetical protein
VLCTIIFTKSVFIIVKNEKCPANKEGVQQAKPEWVIHGIVIKRFL